MHYLYSYNYEGVTGCVVKYSSRQNVLIINLVRELIFGIKRKGNKTGLYLNLVIIALFWWGNCLIVVKPLLLLLLLWFLSCSCYLFNQEFFNFFFIRRVFCVASILICRLLQIDYDIQFYHFALISFPY